MHMWVSGETTCLSNRFRRVRSPSCAPYNPGFSNVAFLQRKRASLLKLLAFFWKNPGFLDGFWLMLLVSGCKILILRHYTQTQELENGEPL